MSGYGPDTDIGRWTRESLAHFQSAARDRSPGEDFFYVQEVCQVFFTWSGRILTLDTSSTLDIDAQPVGG